MRASFETSDAPYARVVSSAMHAVQWHCQRSDVEAELSRAKRGQKWHKQRPPRSSVYHLVPADMHVPVLTLPKRH